MKGCTRIESGTIELYFYDELDAGDRAATLAHLATCGECRRELEEMEMIAAALATRPTVDAPREGDWSAFMARLDDAVADIDARRHAASASPRVIGFEDGPRAGRPGFSRRVAPYLALAALLVLASMSMVYLSQTGRGGVRERPTAPSAAQAQPVQTPAEMPDVVAAANRIGDDAAFAALSEQHFERSKLVVLGLASKDPRHVRREDWEYERQLASSLLVDTRLYRLAAEERGMKRIADVMGDLELVLLQTSFGAHASAEDLEQIQRLIDKRDLVTKMVAGI